MFVLRNNATGEHFIGQLAWSGGYSFEFDLDADPGTLDYAARLFFRAGPDAPPPQRVIAPGETVSTPEVHLGLVFGDLDAAIQAMHDHLRRSVFMPQPRGRGGWVESGIGPEIEITTEQVIHAIDAAADVGAEVFFIDASWYARRTATGGLLSATGRWTASASRKALSPSATACMQKGMLWGLWMDAERIGDESRVAKEHPEWLATAYDGQKAPGRLARPDQPDRCAMDGSADCPGDRGERAGILPPGLQHESRASGSARVRDGFVENGYWRYYEALYAIYDRLRARFPNVIFENCAGGGGRTDIGMVRRFSHTWVTDWQIAPRSFTITNGMTMALPPEYVDRLIGGQSGHTTAEFDFPVAPAAVCAAYVRVLLSAGVAAGILSCWPSEALDGSLQELCAPVHEHRAHLPPHAGGDGPDPQGWGVLELASRDRTRGHLRPVPALGADRSRSICLRLRGLDVSRRYRVTLDNSGQTCEVDGFTLMKQGITVRLEGALTSELLLFEAL